MHNNKPFFYNQSQIIMHIFLIKKRQNLIEKNEHLKTETNIEQRMEKKFIIRTQDRPKFENQYNLSKMSGY